MDEATEGATRAKYGRISIEIDLSKPLVFKFRMRRRFWKAEYESIHMVCFNCKTYGHRDEDCPLKSMEKNPEEEDKAEILPK